MKSIAITLFVTLALQVSCGFARESHSHGPSKFFGTQVFASNDCILPQPGKKPGILGGIAAAVLPSLIEKSLDRLATAIRKAGEESVTNISRSTNIEIDKTLIPTCIQIVHGTFFTKKSQFENLNSQIKEKLLPTNEIKGASDVMNKPLEKLANLGVFIAETPFLFFEGNVRVSEDMSAIAISPSILIYNSLIESTDFKNGTRDLVLSFTFSSAGQSALQGKGTYGQLQFSNLKTGTVLLFPDTAFETPWIPIQITEKKSPRIVSVTASETKDANGFLLFLADVLDGSKDKVETVLKQTLIETERVKLKQQELEAEKNKQQAETDALVTAYSSISEAQISYLDYHQALEKDGTKQVIIQKGNDALSKMLIANLKARHAGLADPFKENAILEIQKELFEQN